MKAINTIVSTAKKPVKVVENVVVETADLMLKDGELERGKGLASGVLAFTLGFLSFLGVLAFHFRY